MTDHVGAGDNAWRNLYWYPPYNTNYPYSPSQAYAYYNPALPPVPELPPIPQPRGIGSSYR